MKPGCFRQSILVESVGRLRTAAGIIAGVGGVTARLDFQNGCPGLGQAHSSPSVILFESDVYLQVVGWRVDKRELMCLFIL